MSSSQPAKESLSGIKDILTTAIPPTKATFRVLTSSNPLDASKLEKHSILGMIVALTLIMVLAMVIILANDSAPFVGPLTSLWTNKIERIWPPSNNVPVLIECGLYVLVACSFGFLASAFAGFQVAIDDKKNRKLAIRLAGYAALGTTFTYVVALIFVAILAWCLYYFKLYIFAFLWMWIAAIALIPFTTWWISKVFQRAAFLRTRSIISGLIISFASILSSSVAATSIMQLLEDTQLKQGHTVNNARSNPMAAIVQACTNRSAGIVCAVTLFPTKWQDYELIGDWQLGFFANSNGPQIPHFKWSPVKEADHEFALVRIESRKDVTIEVHIATDVACNATGTNITKDDQFFSVQGRVIGLQHNAPKEIRIHVDNGVPTFVDLMSKACITQVANNLSIQKGRSTSID